MPVKRTWDNATRYAFWKKVEPAEDGCWIWTGAKRAAGYGTFYVLPTATHPGGKIAHRLAWLDLVGPIPYGLQLDHLCKVTACVNPAHLEPVTGATNLSRKNDVARRPADVVPFPNPARVKHAHPRRLRDAITGYCPRGHEYAVSGWVDNGPGRRTCAACRADAAKNRLKGGQHGTETHCPQGHPYDEGSVRVRSNGERSRECVICRRDRARARCHAKQLTA